MNSLRFTPVAEPARRIFLVRGLELTLLLIICLLIAAPASAAPYVYVVSVDQQFRTPWIPIQALPA